MKEIENGGGKKLKLSAENLRFLRNNAFDIRSLTPQQAQGFALATEFKNADELFKHLGF